MGWTGEEGCRGREEWDVPGLASGRPYSAIRVRSGAGTLGKVTGFIGWAMVRGGCQEELSVVSGRQRAVDEVDGTIGGVRCPGVAWDGQGG